jgi:hypothetical protein
VPVLGAALSAYADRFLLTKPNTSCTIEMPAPIQATQPSDLGDNHLPGPARPMGRMWYFSVQDNGLVSIPNIRRNLWRIQATLS